MKRGILEEVGKMQDIISRLDEEIYNVDTATEKALHVVDAIEAKYRLLDREEGDRLVLQKQNC